MLTALSLGGRLSLGDEKENDHLPEPNTNEDDTMIDNNIVLDGLF